jgi:DNA topoisomerase-2
MPIWSLTLERVEKINRQMKDKEVEIDALIKLSPKDLWTRDLDEFLAEWEAQLDDEKKRAKKIAGMSRRASAKLGIGIKSSKGGKKMKKKRGSDDSDDSGSDFDAGKKKKGKGAALLNMKSAPKAAPNAVSKSKPVAAPTPSNEDDFHDINAMDLDLDEELNIKEAVAVKKPAASKPKAKPTRIELDDDDDDVFMAVAEEAKKKEAAPSRAARAKKTTKSYTIQDDSDDESFNDNDLGDISHLVKGGGAATAQNGRPLFAATARPGSSHGLLSKAKSRSKSQESDEDSIDDTNYEGLIPQDSPRRPAPRNANDTMLLDSDEEDF